MTKDDKFFFGIGALSGGIVAIYMMFFFGGLYGDGYSDAMDKVRQDKIEEESRKFYSQIAQDLAEMNMTLDAIRRK